MLISDCMHRTSKSVSQILILCMHRTFKSQATISLLRFDKVLT